MRRPEPLHPAALLVDQDRRVVAADRLAQRFADQPRTCSGRLDIALEKDEAPGVRRRAESPLFAPCSVDRPGR